MSDDAYKAYIQRALFYGASGRTVEALTGAVFRREPTVELPKTFEDELTDVTLSGVSFQAIAQDIFSRVLGVARAGRRRFCGDFPAVSLKRVSDRGRVRVRRGILRGLPRGLIEAETPSSGSTPRMVTRDSAGTSPQPH